MKVKLKKRIFKIKKRKRSFLRKLIIVFIFLIFAVLLCLEFINKKVSPTLLNVAKIEAVKLSNIIMDYSIDQVLKDNEEIKELFTSSLSDGHITTIDLNSIVVNKLIVSIIDEIGKNLKKIEAGDINDISKNNASLASYDINKMKNGIIYEITSGAIFGNALLANIGPKIPVKISLVGNIIVEVETKLTDYGINNALVELVINVTMEEMVLLPISSEKIVIENDFVIATKLIQGTIPNYYFESTSKSL